MTNKLPPIDFKEEVEKMGAFQEVRDVKFNKCSHKSIKFDNGMLKCPCGVAYSGTRLDELYRLLVK